MIAYDALIRFAKTLEGETLETSAQHKKYTVEIEGEKLIYTLGSGKRRADIKSTVEKVLLRFNATKSFKPGDYGDITMNASYLVRILELMSSGGNHSSN